MEYSSFTLQEILSQPETWQKTIQRLGQYRTNLPQRLKDYDQVLFAGCGSTYYLSLWASRWCETYHGVTSRAVPSSDLILFPTSWFNKNKRTLLVAISRSGRTTETIRAVDHFLAKGCGECVVITCYPDQPLAKMSSFVLGVPDAIENSVVQTRSFTNMMLAVASLIDPDSPRDLINFYETEGKRVLSESFELAKRLGGLHKFTKFVFLGSGMLYGLVNEGMLKVKEMSLTQTEAFHFLEYRHGPISTLDEQTMVIGLLSEEGLDYELAVLENVRELGAYVVGLSAAQNSPLIQKVANDDLLLRSIPHKIWGDPLYLPFLQLLAYYRAVSKGLNADYPANLQSVVELE